MFYNDIYILMYIILNLIKQQKHIYKQYNFKKVVKFMLVLKKYEQKINLSKSLYHCSITPKIKF